MPTGMYLAIGLNHVDTGSPAFDRLTAPPPPLRGCVSDATAIADLLDSRGFRRLALLTNEKATRAAVLGALDTAANQLSSDDLFVLHYSGHGMSGSVSSAGGIDPNSDHTSSWILFDQPFSDGELFQTWGAFKQGVRILVISDSCHSESAIEGAIGKGVTLNDGTTCRVRGLDLETRKEVLTNNKAYFAKDAEIKERLRGSASAPSAAILLLSGCRDDEESIDLTDPQGVSHGLFTSTLLDILNGGFVQDYVQFHQQVAQATKERSGQLDPPRNQNPKFFPLGSPLDVVIFSHSSPPFTI